MSGYEVRLPTDEIAYSVAVAVAKIGITDEVAEQAIGSGRLQVVRFGGARWVTKRALSDYYAYALRRPKRSN
jgi:hypothetical protein